MPSMCSREKLVTFTKVLMPSLMFLFLSSNYSPFKQTGVRRNLTGPGLHCCGLGFQDNTGHKLTENVLDAHRCKPSISFGNVPLPAASNTHLAQIANILGIGIIPQDQCVELYSRLHRPIESRMKAYNRFPHPDWIYDAIEVRDRLRDVQLKVLTHCDMDAPSFKHVNIPLDTNSYDQVTYRPPSTSVNIIRRAVDRVLLNTQEILDMCKKLDLRCRITEIDNLFQQPEANDLCFVLKKFEHAVNIGMQGAENIYPHYASSRMLLVNTRFESWNYSKQINTYRFGNSLASDEKMIGNNLISKDPTLFDWFHLEFGAHFGNYLNAIAGDVDMDSLDVVKQTNPKHQCKANPLYCANYNADVSQIRAELKSLIDKGHLLTINKQKWWIQRCETEKICLHSSRLRATLNGVEGIEDYIFLD